MKNSSDTIGNRTRDLPTCNAVPQPTALPRAPRASVRYVTKSWSVVLLREAVPVKGPVLRVPGPPDWGFVVRPAPSHRKTTC